MYPYIYIYIYIYAVYIFPIYQPCGYGIVLFPALYNIVGLCGILPRATGKWKDITKKKIIIKKKRSPPHAIFNLGVERAVSLSLFISRAG